MSITRIGEFQAKQESIEEMRDFLISIMPGIKSSQGCESVYLYQSQDDPTKFTMIEVWESVESHQASVKNIPAEKLAEIRPLLASPPSAHYYELIHQKYKSSHKFVGRFLFSLLRVHHHFHTSIHFMLERFIGIRCIFQREDMRDNERGIDLPIFNHRKQWLHIT